MILPQLDSLLVPSHVTLDLQGATASEAIAEIVQSLGASGALRQPTEFYDAVMAREGKSSTVANGGVAFPHARTQLVEELVLGIGRSAEGVTFPGAEGKLVRLIFVIAVPQQMVNDYLVCVGALARRVSDAGTREVLLAAASPNEFIEQLRGEN